MYFRHSDEIWTDFPELVCGALVADGITNDVSVADRVARFDAIAESRLASGSEAELPEIQAWRRAFSRMGLEPTRHRCAAEALLRRFRKEGSLPQIHPLIDLCNAISLAFAIPVAVFDVAKIAEHVEVRHATGDESYETFSGETESPDAREVIFADAAGPSSRSTMDEPAERLLGRPGYDGARPDRRRGDARLRAHGRRAARSGDRRRAERGLARACDSAVLSPSQPRFDF